MKEKWEEELVYAYFLHGMKIMENRKLWEVTEKIGMPERVYKTKTEEFTGILTERQKGLFEKYRKEWDLNRKWEELKKPGIRFYPFFHPDYPEKLKTIPDAPWAVYVKGALPKGEIPCIAIVGARQCSEYGKVTANMLGNMLGENRIPVISGMARGIDGISQRAALNAGGESFGILGCGVDICYPKENKELYSALECQGGIISEYPPGIPPAARQFPPRNRIISGLGEALIVIEAKEKSGTLITVDMALEQGREVFVLPGRITDSLSAGCNKLIKQGAAILTSPEDIFQFLGRSITGDKERQEVKSAAGNFRFGTKEEKKIYELLDFMPKNIERIWQEYGKEHITLQQVMKELLELCLKGLAGQAGGSYYRI